MKESLYRQTIEFEKKCMQFIKLSSDPEGYLNLIIDALRT